MSDVAATIWDPLRRKNVALTPEERVRQWFIGVLFKECGIPYHRMSSEVSFNLGDKPFRGDIVVWGKDLSARVLVECKRPEVDIDSAVLQQALVYNMVLPVPYIILTNGTKTVCLKRDAFTGSFRSASSLPSISELD